jgi:hypothetical protein
MIRRVLCVFLIVGLAPGTWVRSRPLPPNTSQAVTVAPLPLPPGCCLIGPVRAEAAWQISSRNSAFGGYSALVARGDGRLVAFSDGGIALDFPIPGTRSVQAPRMTVAIPSANPRKDNRDVESATREPFIGRVWLALEGRDEIRRFGADGSSQGQVTVAAMQQWPGNTGPEAMVRLRDGRFVVLSESYARWFDFTRHPALLFGGDPVSGAAPQSFRFAGAPGYRPTDMAQLPDGRVLIVMRRLVWPFPIRFAMRLMLADPAEIRPGQEWRAIDLGGIEDPALLDNYEGLALIPQPDGLVTGWLISDDNAAALQRTLLIRLAIDPARLPKQKGAPTDAKRAPANP